MLVITRRLGEKVVIPTPIGPIVIQVVGLDRGNIRIGFEAATRIRVWRQEIFESLAVPEMTESVWGKIPVGESTHG